MLSAVDTTSVSSAAISEPMAVRATTQRVAFFVFVREGLMSIEIRRGRAIHRSPRDLLHERRRQAFASARSMSTPMRVEHLAVGRLLRRHAGQQLDLDPLEEVARSSVATARGGDRQLEPELVGPRGEHRLEQRRASRPWPRASRRRAPRRPGPPPTAPTARARSPSGRPRRGSRRRRATCRPAARGRRRACCWRCEQQLVLALEDLEQQALLAAEVVVHEREPHARLVGHRARARRRRGRARAARRAPRRRSAGASPRPGPPGRRCWRHRACLTRRAV